MKAKNFKPFTKHLFSEATALGEEAPRHDGSDAGSFVRPRDRTDDHLARCPSAKRSRRPTSLACVTTTLIREQL